MLLPGHHIIKFLDPDAFDFTQPRGNRITTAFLRSSAAEPESAWCEELGGLASVLTNKKHRPAWNRFGVIKGTVEELQNLGLTITLNPDGCEPGWMDVRDSHCDVTGYTPETRILILRALDHPRYLQLEPDRQQTISRICSCLQRLTITVRFGFDVRTMPDFVHCPTCDSQIFCDGRPLSVTI